MATENSVVCVYNTHLDAEHAVKTLQNSGFNMKQLSIVGKDYHTDEHPIGYYNTGEEGEGRIQEGLLTEVAVIKHNFDGGIGC